MAEDLPRETFDATDPAAAANAARDTARKLREDADQLRLIMRTKPGRAWLYRRLFECHIYGDTFHGEQTHTTAFRLGEENIGKRLMEAAMDASPDLYVQMIKEQREEEKRLDDVRRQEQRKREEHDNPQPQQFAVDLPPPAGYPGGPPLPKPENQKGQ